MEVNQKSFWTRYMVEFVKMTGEMVIHDDWKPFPIEQIKEMIQREKNTRENEGNCLIQLQGFQLHDIINMLDCTSRTRLMRTCKAMLNLCNSRMVQPLELPLRLTVRWNGDAWEALGEALTLSGRNTVDLTPFKERLIETVKIKLDMISIEWKEERWLLPSDVDPMLIAWNVTSSDNLTLKMVGGVGCPWRYCDYVIAQHLVDTLNVNYLTLKNVRTVRTAVYPSVPHISIG